MLIAGVDEVGRGPLAGEVVAAAVILHAHKPVAGLADSKTLSEKRREQLYAEICMSAVSFCVARASVQEIDQLNILQASLLAMRRAVEGLAVQPDKVLVDGNRLPVWRYKAEAIVQGDSKVEVISAASILAKVTRDRHMIDLDDKYPGYGFASHKGYPTRQHLSALKMLGICPIHRCSFAPVKALITQQELL